MRRKAMQQKAKSKVVAVSCRATRRRGEDGVDRQQLGPCIFPRAVEVIP